MNILEKIAVIGSVSAVTVFGLNAYLRPKVRSSKQDFHLLREQLVKTREVRMLYSTMSFFYLQGFRQTDPKSFLTLKEVLKLSPPNLVILQLSPE